MFFSEKILERNADIQSKQVNLKSCGNIMKIAEEIFFFY